MGAAAAFSGTSAPGVQFINIISTKRSGHHAFVAWLEKGSRTGTLFLNNQVIAPPFIDQMLSRARSATVPTAIILNYEGVSTSGVARVLAAQSAAGIPSRNVLFLRDPLNLCASLLNRKRFQVAELVMVLRQLFALRSWLDAYRSGAVAADLVFYNRWLTDDGYLDRVAHRMEVEAGAVGADITAFGGGSSFKDLAEGGRAAAPRLLQRWKGYRDYPLFRSLVSHPQFAAAFLAEVSGDIRDGEGESDRDEDRAAFLEALCRDRRPSVHVDRLIEGLARDESAFETIESLKPGLYKRFFIARTHLRAVLRSSPQGAAGAA